MRAALARALLSLALLAGMAGPAGAQGGGPPPGALELRFLDVGQGDAALIRLGRQAVLLDAGRGDDIVLVLEDLQVDSLVAAIVSHNHDDHIGGMDAVLADYPVGEYLSNGRAPETQNGQSVAEIVARRRIPAPAPPWPPILLGDARISVFRSPLEADRASENNSSLGVLVERGRFKALLTGDSEREELGAWLATGHVPRVTLLKAPHHGARDGITPGWLDATRPEVVVISVGAGNAYGHPDPWALRYYQTHHRRVYRTDRDGTVVVSVDSGGAYTIQTLGPVAR